MADFSHLSANAKAQMVDVSAKSETARVAVVAGRVSLPSAALAAFTPEIVREICSVARVAGLQAMKQTATLIPMCHQLSLDGSTIDISLDQTELCFSVQCTGKTTGKTGVEMECFVGAAIAGATVYDMIKARVPEAIVGPFWLVSKDGGKQGLWQSTHTTL